MSAEAVADAEGEIPEDEDAPAPTKKTFSGKRIVLFIVLPLLLLGGGGAGVYFSGLADSLLGGEAAGEAAEDEPEEAVAEPLFFDLPELLVNLNTKGRKTSYLKLTVSLELTDPAHVPLLKQVLPRVIDQFQVYLRELRAEDLKGSTGIHRLREELLRRVNLVAKPAHVNDVLFKEMLVQ